MFKPWKEEGDGFVALYGMNGFYDSVEARHACCHARKLQPLGRALAGVVNLVDPHAIVLGGGLSQVDAVYRELPARIGPHVFSDRFETPVLPPRYGDDSGLRGAAWLWPAAGEAEQRQWRAQWPTP